MESEFKENRKIAKIFEKYGFNIARMICGSKSLYRNNYPDNIVFFNANIITISNDKVWYGDLDITLDEKKLIEVSKELKEPLYILQELAGRFDEEKEPTKELISRASYIIYPDGKIENTNKSYCGYVFSNGKKKLISNSDLNKAIKKTKKKK